LLKNCGYECNGCGATLFNGDGALLIVPGGEKFAFCNRKCMSKWLQSLEPIDANKELEAKVKALEKKTKQRIQEAKKTKPSAQPKPR
jgi:ribosomal protein L24E